MIDSILEHFLPRFYKMKMDKRELEIKIELSVEKENIQYGFRDSYRNLKVSELPDLKSKNIPDEESLFSNFTLRYSVEHDFESKSLITAICADGRTISIPIITNKQFPYGYKMVFICILIILMENLIQLENH